MFKYHLLMNITLTANLKYATRLHLCPREYLFRYLFTLFPFLLVPLVYYAIALLCYSFTSARFPKTNKQTNKYFVIVCTNHPTVSNFGFHIVVKQTKHDILKELNKIKRKGCKHESVLVSIHKSRHTF